MVLNLNLFFLCPTFYKNQWLKYNLNLFENTIHEAGLHFEKHFCFPDHYDFNNKEIIKQISADVKLEKMDHLLTTEKDFAKLQFIEHDLPLVIVEVEFVLENEEELKI